MRESWGCTVYVRDLKAWRHLEKGRAGVLHLFNFINNDNEHESEDLREVY